MNSSNSTKTLVLKRTNYLSKKNKDYSAEDAFGNFKQCERLGICEADLGVLIRLSDKLSRLCNIRTKKGSVTSESERDTVIDMINYLSIYLALRSDGAKG